MQTVEASAFASSIVVSRSIRKHDNHDEGGNSSSPSAKLGAILTRVKEWLSAVIAHVEAIVRPSELMNKRRPIPLPLAKSAKKTTVRPLTTQPASAAEIEKS